MTNNTNAASVCIPEYLPPEPSTCRIPAETMSTLVYGPRRRPLISRQVAFRAVLLGALVGLLGCATAPRPVTAEVESVGQLSASYHSVAVAPVHASTDLTPAFQAIATDDDAPADTVTTVTRAPDAGEADAAAEVPTAVEKQAHGF